MKKIEFKNGSSIYDLDNVDGHRGKVRYYVLDSLEESNLDYYKEISTGMISKLIYTSNNIITLENYDTTYEVTYEEFKKDFIKLR